MRSAASPEDDIVSYAFSSGSTGFPKSVPRASASGCASAMVIAEAWRSRPTIG
jgi:phenylacetate-coenzyme A ligase PaaK-like adenylate-forming protein